ncbi:MAG: type IV secretion system protein [Alphaproteobacteria bacterium]|nr:type IV secretion system protein [Alphaproteobacteria bacterium]
MFGIFRTIFKYKEKASPDVLGKYPELLHVSAMPERRYLWTSRILVIIACISICINMALAGIVYLLLPQRSALPRLLHINRYFSILETVQPSEINVPATSMIMEQYITQYIMYRYIITQDYDELMSRWERGGILYWYSSPAVYEEFVANDAKLNTIMFREKNMQRDTEIDWIRPLGKNLWQVQFRTMDYLPNISTPDTNIWRANLRTAFIKQNLKRSTAILNPFGFTVMNYSLGYMGKPGSPASYMEHIKQKTSDYYKAY